MFYCADWTIKAFFEGDWPRDTLQRWWGMWNETAEIIFSCGFGDLDAHTGN